MNRTGRLDFPAEVWFWELESAASRRQGKSMIRHIVYFSVRSASDRQRVLDGLRLLEANPHAELLEVEENLKLDSLGNEVDFVVYGEFADAAALDAFKAHPSYQASIAAVRPHRELRMAADVVARERPSS